MEFITYFNEWFIRHLLIVLIFVLPSILVFWAVKRKVLPFIFKSENSLKKVLHKFYRFLVIYWLISILIYIIFSVNESPISTLIILTTIGIVAFSFWKDLLIGLYLCYEGKLKTGQVIQCDGIKGEISTFSPTRIQLIDKAGNEHFIQYTRLEKSGYSICQEIENHLKEVFIFSIQKEFYPDAEIEIRKQLISNPWVLSDRGIDIQFKDDFIEIVVQLIEKDAKTRIKNLIKQKIDSYSSEEGDNLT